MNGGRLREIRFATVPPRLERHNRRAGDHVERPDARQVRDHVLGDAVGEVLVFRIAAQGEERQDGDGRARRWAAIPHEPGRRR
jgi:hypothetical protein